LKKRNFLQQTYQGGAIMYLEYFETTADDFMDHCHWDEALKQGARKPVAANGFHSFDHGQTQRMIDLAWFENPRRPVEISLWDEATKRKMREPVLSKVWYHSSDDFIKNLIAFASLY
jgi:hypothetical protein